MKAKTVAGVLTCIGLVGAGLSVAMPPAVAAGPCDAPATGAAGEFAAGSGTDADPYLIVTAVQLRLASDLGCRAKTFVQTADIDLASVTWDQIGPSTTTPFTGKFYGNDCVIGRLTTGSLASGNDYAGMFGATAGATLAHIRLRDVNVSAYEYAGGLVGVANPATISDISVTGTVRAYRYTGGIAGTAGKDAASSTTLTRAAFLDASSATSDNTEVGGLVGNIDGYSAGGRDRRVLLPRCGHRS